MILIGNYTCSRSINEKSHLCFGKNIYNTARAKHSRYYVLMSNNMTRGKLAIKLPDVEGGFVKDRGRSPRTFTNLPETKGNLIANFPTSQSCY
jgi:hypothetical protein